jgi:hypothetical protein
MCIVNHHRHHQCLRRCNTSSRRHSWRSTCTATRRDVFLTRNTTCNALSIAFSSTSLLYLVRSQTCHSTLHTIHTIGAFVAEISLIGSACLASKRFERIWCNEQAVEIEQIRTILALLTSTPPAPSSSSTDNDNNSVGKLPPSDIFLFSLSCLLIAE